MQNSLIPNGAKYIQSLLDTAVQKGEHRIVVSGSYEMEETVYIPEEMTVILDSCYLRMRDGVYCQMFCNEHGRPNTAHDGTKPDRNIRIIGRGHTVLDGGEYNGLSEANSLQNGMPCISQNNMILLCNVEGFLIENIDILRQRWWAINLLYCRNGLLRDIHFEADYTRVGKNGEITVGLDHSDYRSTRVKNADGIDLRCGCHDITVENITGFTEDDSVALTALLNILETKLYAVSNVTSDIYNIVIRNVQTAAFCTQVRLLNQGGTKLYNILIDGVFDSSLNCRYYKGRGVAGVRIGDCELYGSRHSTANETYNIRVTNVYSRATYALRFAGCMTNVTYDHIHGFDGCTRLIEDLSPPDAKAQGCVS